MEFPTILLRLEVLGHSNPVLSLRVYAHAMREEEFGGWCARGRRGGRRAGRRLGPRVRGGVRLPACKRS